MHVRAHTRTRALANFPILERMRLHIFVIEVCAHVECGAPCCNPKRTGFGESSNAQLALCRDAV